MKKQTLSSRSIPWLPTGIHLLLAASLLLAGCALPAPEQPVYGATPPATASLLTSAPTRAGQTAEPTPASAAALPVQPTPSSSQQIPVHQALFPVVAVQARLPLLPGAPTTGPVARIAIDPRLPASVKESLPLPPELALADDPETAELRLEIGSQHPFGEWIYVLAAPFPTLEQEVSAAQVQNAWQNKAGGPFAGQPLLMDESTRASLSALWGEPAPGAVQVLPSTDLLAAAWERRSAGQPWAILPFEALEPRWSVLSIDGQSPLHKDFDPAAYLLRLPLSLNDGLNPEAAPLANAVRTVYGPRLLPPANRDPARLSVVALTGVTALVRATAHAMQQKGIDYPAGDIGEILRAADLTHISNEVPFAQDCPPPDPFQLDMRFCSDPRSIGLLETVGTDIVELTGDHFQDWGQQAILDTLAMYQERGWQVFGGGANLEQGRRALLVEHNGNKLAFIGCNAKGGGYAQAGANKPGAVLCDLDWMAAEVSRLRGEGYLPLVTFQHFEYYTYQAQPDQQRDFRRMAEAGAVIVSGSQAHQPQALEFLNGALIHYGLGNLFFDQYEVSQATRQGFIDRHIFYNGRYLGVELLPILFIDYARPRPMTPAEAKELFKSVFKASGW